MKKLIAVGITIMILMITSTGCSQSSSGNNDSKNNAINEVYLLSGGNEFIEINNGAIVLTSKSELFIGGDLSFKGEALSNVKDYKAEFFIMKDEAKTSFNNTINSIEGSDEGISVAPDMGSTSGEKLFNADVWDIITETGELHFSLSGTFINGTNFGYSIVLDVKEVFPETAKS